MFYLIVICLLPVDGVFSLPLFLKFCEAAHGGQNGVGVEDDAVAGGGTLGGLALWGANCHQIRGLGPENMEKLAISLFNLYLRIISVCF